jgi:mannan endo-1,4-beta-mannosidase
VQGRLTDEQWNDVITPGTELYNHWCAQVDVIAGYLKQLQAARIPVLWRPYHEMNGNWFWWGGAAGRTRHDGALPPVVRPAGELSPPEQSGLDLERGPARHKRRPVCRLLPRQRYFDIAALDVYRNDFQQSYYDGLLKLADGKPVTLAEVGPAPAPAVLKEQPKWTWWMLWAVEAEEGWR